MRCTRCGTENPDNATSCKKCNATLKRVCPRCRAANAPRQVFCGNCGLKLVNICPRCKAQNSPVQKYCGNCGLKIINFCPKCNMNNPIGQRYCGNCATKLMAPTQKEAPKGQKGPAKQKPQRQPSVQQIKKGTAKPEARQAQPPLRQKQALPRKPQPKGVPAPQTEQKPQPAARPVQKPAVQPQRPDIKKPPRGPKQSPLIDSEPVQQVQKPAAPAEPQKVIKQPQPPVMPEGQPEPVQQVQKPAAPAEPQKVIKQPQPPVMPEGQPEPVQQVQKPAAPAEPQKVIKQPQPPVMPEGQPETVQQVQKPAAPEEPQKVIKQPQPPVMPEGQPEPVQQAQKPDTPAEQFQQPPELPPIEEEVHRVAKSTELPQVQPEPVKPTDSLIPKVSELSVEEVATQQQQQTPQPASEPTVAQRAVEEETVIQEEDTPPPAPIKEERKTLKRFAVLSIEIVNFASLSEKVDMNALNNIKGKLWEVCANVAGLNGETLSEISQNTALISFAHANNKENSSLNAIHVAGEVFELTKTLNQQFENALNISLKTKIGISFNDSEGTSQLERSIASVGSIVVSEEIKKDTESICEYDPIGPLPIGNQMVSFYKYKVPDKPIRVPAATGSPEDINDQGDLSSVDSSSLGDDLTEEFVEEPEPEAKVDSKTLDKDGVISSLMNICSLTDSTGQGNFVNINGDDGSGKSAIIRTLKTSLSPQSFIWLIARCNFIEKTFPLSTVKDLLINFFGLPYMVYDRMEAKKTIKTGVESLIGPNDQICSVLYSLLLNEEVSGLNKGHIINALFTIIKAITQKATVIFTIEDFDAIDDTSLEIFEALIDARLGDQKVVVVTTTHLNYNMAKEKPNFIHNSKFTQYNIKPIDPSELDFRINEITQSELRLPDPLKEQIVNATNCIPLGLEGALFLMFELGVIVNTENGTIYNEEASQWELPPNMQEILRHRMHRLSQVNPNAFMLLQMASVIGPKFDPAMLRDISMQGKEFDDNINLLGSLGYIVFEGQNCIVFKHNIFWELMYYAGIPNEHRAQSHVQILSFVEKVLNSGGSIDEAFVAYQAENSGKRRKALNIWNSVANKILALGTPKGYTELMKRYINLIEQTDLPNKQHLQIQALETLGKVCFIIEPDLAIEALLNILPVIEQQNDPAKLIELRGILGLAYEQQGRWEESVDQVNKSLELLPSEIPSIEKALLQISVLSSNEKMGRIGWIISTCQKEIFPILEKAIQEGNTPESMTADQLYRAYCNAKLAYASALIVSGHHEAFNVFNEIMPEIEKRGYQDLGLKAYILQAKWRAVRGELEFSEKILTQTREYLNKLPGLNNFTVLWGEAACFLNLEMANWEVLANISDGLKQQAKKLNNYPIIALCMISKGMLAQVKGNPNEALRLLNDTLSYCSKYKLTTYALMTWYFIAASEIQNKNLDKAYNIALKALDIAKTPDIFNLNAIIALNRLIGEISIKKGELEISGAHLEEAWKLATEIQNHSQVAKVAITIGQMYQELVSSAEENKQENAEKAMEFLGNAHNIFEQLGHQLHTKRAEQAIENLKVVCKVNSIDI